MRLRGVPARAMMALAIIAGLAQTAEAQKTVQVTVPPGVSFTVIDVSASTAGSPASTTVTWAHPQGFANADHLRVLVQAATPAFLGPGSTHPAASKVSWTASASTGTPSNGTLSSAAFTAVWVSPTKLKNSDAGTISQSWTLAAIAAAGLRSGTHTLSVTWRFEVF